MTKLDPSVYKRRNELLRNSKVLQGILLDSDLQFDNYYKMKMEQEDAYQRWKFYNNIIKTFNKKDPK
jgi:hypothetical protein